MALTAYQAHMKRELKGKMKGKTKAQRKAIFKAAAKSYKKKGSTKPRARAKPKSKSTGGRSTMGKKNGFNTQKIFKYVRLGALALPAATTIMSNKPNDIKIAKLSKDYTGFDPRDGSFDLARLIGGYGPVLGATLATYGIPKLAAMIRGL